MLRAFPGSGSQGAMKMKRVFDRSKTEDTYIFKGAGVIQEFSDIKETVGGLKQKCIHKMMDCYKVYNRNDRKNGNKS